MFSNHRLTALTVPLQYLCTILYTYALRAVHGCSIVSWFIYFYLLHYTAHYFLCRFIAQEGLSHWSDRDSQDT
jgi:hypothetical protein